MATRTAAFGNWRDMDARFFNIIDLTSREPRKRPRDAFDRKPKRQQRLSARRDVEALSSEVDVQSSNARHRSATCAEPSGLIRRRASAAFHKLLHHLVQVKTCCLLARRKFLEGCQEFARPEGIPQCCSCVPPGSRMVSASSSLIRTANADLCRRITHQGSVDLVA